MALRSTQHQRYKWIPEIFLWAQGGRHLRLTTSPPSASHSCLLGTAVGSVSDHGNLDVSQAYGPPLPGTGIVIGSVSDHGKLDVSQPNGPPLPVTGIAVGSVSDYGKLDVSQPNGPPLPITRRISCSVSDHEDVWMYLSVTAEAAFCFEVEGWEFILRRQYLLLQWRTEWFEGLEGIWKEVLDLGTVPVLPWGTKLNHEESQDSRDSSPDAPEHKSRASLLSCFLSRCKCIKQRL
jgi:hypothetical protein